MFILIYITADKVLQMLVNNVTIYYNIVVRSCYTIHMHYMYRPKERNVKLMSKIIMGIKLQERVKSATKVQELLTKYGCEISTRIGLHVASQESCSPQGLIVLEFIDDAEDSVAEFEKELAEIGDFVVQKMIF